MSDAAATATTATDQTTAANTNILSADPAWASFDDETKGAFQSHGWDRKSAAEAAAEALKSYREAQKFLGVPKEQLLRLPKDASDEAGWKSVYQRLGVPAKAEDYDFSGVKYSDGSELEPGFAKTLRSALLDANVSKDKAVQVAKSLAKYADDDATTEKADVTGKIAKQKELLANSWGQNTEDFKFLARKGAADFAAKYNASLPEELRLSPQEVVEKLEESTSYFHAMNILKELGKLSREDSFVSSPNGPSQSGLMTREEATARIAELSNDADFGKRYFAGEAKAIKELDNLTRIARAA